MQYETSELCSASDQVQSTGEVVPVEPGEAKWNLDTLKHCLINYFVQPVVISTQEGRADKKLKDAGNRRPSNLHHAQWRSHSRSAFGSPQVRRTWRGVRAAGSRSGSRIDGMCGDDRSERWNER